MMNAIPARRARAGFTLLEILVALVLIGLLVGTLVPAVLNQLGKGEVNRVVEDLNGISVAAKSFRVDVQRWPGDLEDLTSAISSTDTAFPSGSYPAGVFAKWAGPYLEGVVVADGGTLSSASGAVISDNFVSKTLGSQPYLSVEVTGLTTEMMEQISTAVDGDTNLTDSDLGGRVRAVSSTLVYLAASTR